MGFTIFVAQFGTRTVRRVMPRVQARLSLAEAEFALAMTLLFALSLLAVYAGVAAIVGAFLAGMALSETVDHRVSTSPTASPSCSSRFSSPASACTSTPPPSHNGHDSGLAALIFARGGRFEVRRLRPRRAPRWAAATPCASASA